MAAGVLLRDKNGKILVVSPNYTDNWNLVGGVIDEDESPQSAALREVKEEIGLEFKPQDLRLAVVAYRPGVKGYHDSMYFVFDGGELPRERIDSIRLQEEELDEFKFIAPDEVTQYLDAWKASYVQHVIKEPLKTWYIENTEIG